MIARGTQQLWWFNELTTGEEMRNPQYTVVGKAKLYSQRYGQSFANLLDRMRAEGWEIERTPGKRGGDWGATYRAYLRIERDGV